MARNEASKFLTLALAAVLGGASATACASSGSSAWRNHDVLQDQPVRAKPAVRGVSVDGGDYLTMVRLGEHWFRSEAFGGERATTDVAGLFGAEIEIPCAPSETPPNAATCRRRTSVFPYFISALDRLDGVIGNLFPAVDGQPANGGAFTNDLVIELPPGTTLAGLPVPERLHTGLDVDAGASWPVGVIQVPAPESDAHLPYLVERKALGAGPAPAGKVRLAITCALCHYSLDVDKDGRADLRSTRWGETTPGSPFEARHSWGIGNQDVHFGWLFALTRNPLMGFTVLSGPVGKNDPKAAIDWVRWIKENYRTSPQAVRREVIRGMLVQPRGFADDSPNAIHDPNQLPVLFTFRNWPYNYDGSFIDPSDRNNGVWTGAIDFTGLISLAGDRSGGRSGALYWEPRSVYDLLSAEDYADMMVDQSPAVAFDPSSRRRLKDDILGLSDGIPGMLDPKNVVVMKNDLGALPDAVLNHPENIAQKRQRVPETYGGDAENRGSMMVLFGTRVTTTQAARRQPEVAALLAKYPALNVDDFQSDSVSALLDWLTPPPNKSPLLSRAKALVPAGYQVFREEGCGACHTGPFLTDNRMHRLFDRRSQEIGIAAPSTAPFRPLGRGSGPAIRTTPYRSLANRPLQLYVAPPYDPETGLAVQKGGVAPGFIGSRPVGYKTLTLRYLWGSAPYLHDGGVAVTLRPGTAPPGDDLARLLARPEADKWYGMGTLLAYREKQQVGEPWPNAALSLQALLLRSEREKVLADNRRFSLEVPIGHADNPLGAPRTVSMVLLGVEGTGHEFWIDDTPGGERITALIAFLLALDDAPAELP
jgi:mono/diheme cytochrome c family protein